MKTKRKAIRRVSYVPSLESINLCGFAGEKGTAVLDLESEAMVSGTGGVDVSLDPVSKRLCRGKGATSQFSTGSGSIQSENTQSREEGDTFPGVLGQSFESILHVGPPDVQQRQSTVSSKVDEPTPFKDKRKRKAYDLSDEDRLASGQTRPISPAGFNHAELLCNLLFFLCFN